MKVHLSAVAIFCSLLLAAPVAAQEHHDQAQGRARQGQARPRAQPQQQPPRSAPPRSAQPRQPEQRRPPQGRAGERARGTTGRAVPRGSVPPRVRAYPEPRFYGYSRPHVIVPVVPYARPYYVFRPRFWIGYGLYVGVPVPYPLIWGYPSYVYGYPDGYAGGPIIENPPPGTYGGVSFDITPPDATVSVDGVYVGVAEDFGPSRQPLTLTPGRHHIELQAPGMEPLAFDVDVVAGEVVPYRGTLMPR